MHAKSRKGNNYILYIFRNPYFRIQQNNSEGKRTVLMSFIYLKKKCNALFFFFLFAIDHEEVSYLLMSLKKKITLCVQIPLIHH